MSAILITGATGFVGRRLLARIDPASYDKVYCLGRHVSAASLTVYNNDKFEHVTADLLDPASYADYLSRVNTVVHLAAITGKCPPDQYFRVNRDATDLLLQQAKKAGVKRFLHVSTIAVKYPNKDLYYYALAKEQAEYAVKQSGLSYTIARPTIVLGPKSPIWDALTKLAKLPVVPIFGHGQTRIQPIHVDDLADSLLYILEHDLFNGDTIELGGPEQITFEQFLSDIHRLYHGKDPRTLHIPLRPVIALLSLVERPLYKAMPLTVGQLCAFHNDSTIEPNAVFDANKDRMLGIDQMLQQAKDQEQLGEHARENTLDQQCQTFTAYLVGAQPDGYILSKYRQAHSTSPQLSEPLPCATDQAFITIASKHPWLTRLVDSYTRILAPHYIIRRKLTVLLAILETSPATFRYFDLPDPGSKAMLLLRVIGNAFFFTLSLALSLVVLGPIHLLSSLRSSTKRDA